VNGAAALPFVINEGFVLLSLVIGMAVEHRTREFNVSALAAAEQSRAVASHTKAHPEDTAGLSRVKVTPWILPDHLRASGVAGQVSWAFDAASVGGAILIPFYVFIDAVHGLGVLTSLVYGLAALLTAGLATFVIFFQNPAKWNDTRTKSEVRIFRLTPVSWILVTANILFALAAVAWVPVTTT
jgi:hypothetical protein